MNFKQIYIDHCDLVYNLCLQYLQNTEDAEEVTQDVFVKVNEAFDKFQHQSKIDTWIYRITINACQDFIRFKNRKKRSVRLLSIFFDQHDTTSEPRHFDHPGVALEQKEKVARLFHQINKLPENQKSAIILNKIEHKSIADIADILEISTKAAESLIQRAKHNLLKFLSANEGKT